MALIRPRFSQLNTIVTSIDDPITVLNKGSTSANIDVGFIVNRDGGNSSNLAMIWDQTANNFAFGFTTASGATNANISIGTYANLRAGSFIGDGSQLTGIVSGYGNTNVASYISGNITVGNVIVANTAPGRLRVGGVNGIDIVNSSTGNYITGIGSFLALTGGGGATPNTTAYPGLIARNETELDLYGGRGNINLRTSNANSVVVTGNLSSTSTTTGALRVTGGLGVAGNLYANTIYGNIGGGSTLSNIHVTGSLIPTANITFDLGSPTQRWRDGWFSGTTIYIGSESMGVDENGKWTFTSGGATVELGSNVAFNPPSANISGNVSASYILGNGVLDSLTVSGNIQFGSDHYVSQQYVLWGTTSNNSETELFIGGVSSTRIPVATNRTVFYEIQIVARRTDATGESGSWHIKGCADNFSDSVGDVGDIYEVIVARDDMIWTVDARADDTTNSVNVYVTGATGKTIRWTAVVKTIEVAQ